MPKMTQIFALILILLGVGAYFVTGMQSATALIPAFFGAPVLLTGLLAARPNARRALWMHIATLLMALGLLGTLRGAFGIFTLIGGGEVARPGAVIVQFVMAIVCVVFVVLAVRSFIQARRAPAPQPGA